MDLPLLMAVEFSKEWASTKHRYIYTHHVHHKTSKDYAGITVESLRESMSDSHTTERLQCRGFTFVREWANCQNHTYFNINQLFKSR
jgi:hypothetical protein